MRNILFVYDNIMKPNKKIKTIIGNKSYSDIILKRRKLYEKYENILIKEKYVKDIVVLNNTDDLKSFKQSVQNIKDLNIVHIFSNYLFKDEKNFKMILNKACYINENILIKSLKKIVMVMYENIDDYYNFLNNYDLKKSLLIDEKWPVIDSEEFINLENYNEFLYYISGGFDTRFFNQMINNEYSVTKKSQDKEKIKKEYMYYMLLPEDAKRWMVQPYNYKENEKEASYTMERFFMPDLAIRWTHGAISVDEFEKILDRLFYYINTRSRKEIPKEQYEKIEEELYINKLEKRIKQLKEYPKYEVLAEYINKRNKL